MHRIRIALALVLLVLLGAWPSSAGLITFSSPTIAATRQCEGGAPRPAYLERYEESGVRVLSNEEFANRFSCDPAQAFGPFGQWQPLLLRPGETSYGPIVYWWMDGASLDVQSLSGLPILGIDLTVVEKNSTTDWCSEIVQSAAGSISLCDDFEGRVTFADYGLDGLTSFSLGWGHAGARLFSDPYVVLRGIEVADPPAAARGIAVPEPSAAALLLIGCLAIGRRIRGGRA